MADDDDEEFIERVYENGHWEWNENIQALAFVSDLNVQEKDIVDIQPKAHVGTIRFKDDIDLVQQVRYRRRYQRKVTPGEPNVVTLQDVKDLVIYTAPTYILSTKLIKLLHLPTTERFLRALILFCGYYLQVSDEMEFRVSEADTKLRTLNTDIVENEFKDNLNDLRALVAKEYATMIMGGDDLRKFHHMGPHKRMRSLSYKDARIMETFFRFAVQIVWIALGRQDFNKLELEINRILKTENFNNVEHALKTNYIDKMHHTEKAVLLGPCVRNERKLKTRSPLINEVFCPRTIDYHLMGLGVIKYPNLESTRLKYFLMAIHGAEDKLSESGVILGIIGLPRNAFDTALHPVQPLIERDSKLIGSKGSIQSNRSSSFNKSMSSSSKKIDMFKRIYPIIELPEKSDTEIDYPPTFPDDMEPSRPISEVQKKRWLLRHARLTGSTI